MAVQKLVVRDACEASPIMPSDIALVMPDGTPFVDYILARVKANCKADVKAAPKAKAQKKK